MHNIQIESQHLKVTDALEQFVHKKVDHLDKYFSGVHNIHVFLRMENERINIAELVVNVVKGKQLIAKAKNEDMYAAIDDAVHKMKEQLVKFKERLRDHKVKSLKTALRPPELEPEDEDEDEALPEA